MNHLQRWYFAVGSKVHFLSGGVGLKIDREKGGLVMLWPEAPGVEVVVEEADEIHQLSDQHIQRADTTFCTDGSGDRERSLPVLCMPFTENRQPSYSMETAGALLQDLIYRSIDVKHDLETLKSLT